MLRRAVAALRRRPWAGPAMRTRDMIVALLSAGLDEKAVDGGVVDVDALVGELAVVDGEDRAGVDLDDGVVVEVPDTGDFEDGQAVVFLPDVDQRVGQ